MRLLRILCRYMEVVVASADWVVNRGLPSTTLFGANPVSRHRTYSLADLV